MQAPRIYFTPLSLAAPFSHLRTHVIIRCGSEGVQFAWWLYTQSYKALPTIDEKGCQGINGEWEKARESSQDRLPARLSFVLVSHSPHLNLFVSLFLPLSTLTSIHTPIYSRWPFGLALKPSGLLKPPTDYYRFPFSLSRLHIYIEAPLVAIHCKGPVPDPHNFMCQPPNGPIRDSQKRWALAIQEWKGREIAVHLVKQTLFFTVLVLLLLLDLSLSTNLT